MVIIGHLPWSIDWKTILNPTINRTVRLTIISQLLSEARRIIVAVVITSAIRVAKANVHVIVLKRWGNVIPVARVVVTISIRPTVDVNTSYSVSYCPLTSKAITTVRGLSGWLQRESGRYFTHCSRTCRTRRPIAETACGGVVT